MPDPLHLVKVPLLSDQLVGFSRRRRLPLRDLDDGYLAHCVLREIWKDRAPVPFVLRADGRAVDAWGYSRADATSLIRDAQASADESLLNIVAGIHRVQSRSMPLLGTGRRVGFRLRACPVVRLARAVRGHRQGAEVDAFLARCFAAAGAIPETREDVYREWLATRVSATAATGISAIRIKVAGISRERLARRTSGPERRIAHLQRPEVWFEGELVVDDGERFLDYLAHGVGRHRAFGFGALMLLPLGASMPT